MLKSELSVAKTMDSKIGSGDKMVPFSWIEKQFVFLTSRLGIYRPGSGKDFFFEPTPGFYGFISQGTTQCLNEGMMMLARHIGASSCPIIEQWKGIDNPLISSDYDWGSDKKPAGLIHYPGSGRSRIQLNITNKHSPFIMGSILAHELLHHFLDLKGIRLSDTQENEKLTDLATVFVGLGKLTLNRYEPITWKQTNKEKSTTWTYQVGYLNTDDMAAIIHHICIFRNIPLHDLMVNLSDKSKDHLNCIEKKAEDFNLKKKLAGEQQCPHCEQFATFSFSEEEDDGLYCSQCRMEYSDCLMHAYKKRNANNGFWRRFYRRVFHVK